MQISTESQISIRIAVSELGAFARMAREGSEVRATLTPREHEVMELLAVGSSSKAIAAALHISVRTVGSHRRTVLRKLGVSSAAQLARAVARIQLP